MGGGLTKVLMDREITKSTLVSREEGKKVKISINIMYVTIESELEKVGELEACELWVIHRESINTHFDNRGKGRHKLILVHPVLLNCAIEFLVKTSPEIYNEVRRLCYCPISATFIGIVHR